jgi:hypothetical protein
MKKPKQKIVVCPLCRTYYSYHVSRKDYVCEECNGELFDVHVDYDAYMALPDEEKSSFKGKYLEEHFANYVPPFRPEPQSGLSGFIGCCGFVTLALLLIVGLITFAMGSYGAGIATMISAPVSGGLLILFSNVADDVHHIRNQVDKLHHDQKYKQP